MSYGGLRLGAGGEGTVAAWYEARGYEILDRNWRCREGELDVVARQDHTVVFCEVKTRSSDRFGHGFEAVTRAKQAKLRVLASRYLEAHHMTRTSVRFDVAAITAGHLEVLESAF